MRFIISIVIFLHLTDIANAASAYYRFEGEASEPHIDFTLEVDFAREGFTIDGFGYINYFDSSRETFYVGYQSGNYSLAPSANQFQRFYGEDVSIPEGISGCLYVLKSIGICDHFDSEFGGVHTWQAGSTLTLHLFDNMGHRDTSVSLESISSVPLPAPLFFMLSGLISLFLVGRRKYNNRFQVTQETRS